MANYSFSDDNHAYQNYSYDYEIPLFYEDDGSVHSHLSPLRVVSLLAYIIVFLIGIPGNVLVIWMTAFEIKRTVNTTWFLNLAIADIFCCLSLPFLITQLIMDYHWPFGNVLCKVFYSAKIFNMFASVYLLMVVSIDRCILVKKPVWGQNKRTVFLASLVCCVVWILALIMAIPSVVFRHTTNVTTSSKVICESAKDFSYIHGNHIAQFILGFCIPLIVIMVCYSIVMIKVRGSQFSTSRRTYILILSVIVAFFVCWLPYHLISLSVIIDQRLFSSKILHVLDNLAQSMAYFNSCINPIIYVIIGQNFKDKFKKSFRSAFKNMLADDSSHLTISTKTRSKSLMEEKCLHTNI
ncbi:C3a anaphylatoxin chemotactic receptor-like [Protopterus annectens]|uniref:C3a anaphylatoxin chemotactic receptor-like n=1 Tax=Protopterus annectens TaxID=7888 RepID=UPI001CFB58D0|nr:C3a anaphylatoxin chemotactic receptor-like [Protopterus annectens]XP_043936104.1 C3a anaphylatoxin chemotactic receptor-like [Protopterus annectens]